MKQNFGKLLLTFVVGVLIFVGITVSFKAALLTASIFCILMYTNTVLTTLGNAMIGRDIDVNYDIFWKLLFIILSSIGFGIYFNI